MQCTLKTGDFSKQSQCQMQKAAEKPSGERGISCTPCMFLDFRQYIPGLGVFINKWQGINLACFLCTTLNSSDNRIEWNDRIFELENDFLLILSFRTVNVFPFAKIRLISNDCHWEVNSHPSHSFYPIEITMFIHFLVSCPSLFYLTTYLETFPYQSIENFINFYSCIAFM